MNSFNLHNNTKGGGQWINCSPHFREQEVEAQRCTVTFPGCPAPDFLGTVTPQLCREVCSCSLWYSFHGRTSHCHSPAIFGHTATTSPFSTVLPLPSNQLASRLPANNFMPWTAIYISFFWPWVSEKDYPETTSPVAHVQVFRSEHCPWGKRKQASTAGGCSSERKAEEWHRASLQTGVSGLGLKRPGVSKGASESPRVVRELSVAPPLSAAQRFPRDW